MFFGVEDPEEMAKMYSNSIVKFEHCQDPLDEDQPEVDPFIDISSLNAQVKVETLEEPISHSSISSFNPISILSPNPIQDSDEINPVQIVQVKMEVEEEEVEDVPPKEKLKKSSTQAIKKAQKTPLKMTTSSDCLPINEEIFQKIIAKNSEPKLIYCLRRDMDGDQALVYLPKNGSIRCELCFQISRIKLEGIPCINSAPEKEILQKSGLQIANTSFPGHQILAHLKSKRHSFCLSAHEMVKLPEAIIFPISQQDFEKITTIHRIPPLLIDLLKADMAGESSLAYLPKSKSFRCELCFRNPSLKDANNKNDFIIEKGIHNSVKRIGRTIKDHLESLRHLNSRSNLNKVPPEPLIPVKKEHEINPGEIVVVKMEEIESESVFDEFGDDSSLDEDEGHPSEDLVQKYGKDLYNSLKINPEILAEIIKKHSPSPKALAHLKSDMNGDRCLVYLPNLRSLRCDHCFTNKSLVRYTNSSSLIKENGMKFSRMLGNRLQEHLNRANHNLTFVLEGCEENDSDPVFLDLQIIELMREKYKLSQSLVSVFEADKKGNQSLVYLPQLDAIRCERCFRDKSIVKNALPKQIYQKIGINLPLNAGFEVKDKIIKHFISDQHEAVVNLQKCAASNEEFSESDPIVKTEVVTEDELIESNQPFPLKSDSSKGAGINVKREAEEDLEELNIKISKIDDN